MGLISPLQIVKLALLSVIQAGITQLADIKKVRVSFEPREIQVLNIVADVESVIQNHQLISKLAVVDEAEAVLHA
jgi:hypothetical protein